MISFESDYNCGCHPELLRHLAETNGEQAAGYGYDRWTESARQKIRAATGDPEAQVWLLSGGTQTNATVIDSMLHTYEGVLCVDTGHIATHEAGAVEFTEHKVITIPGHDGKMEAHELDRWMDAFLHDGAAEHSVYPGMVYITLPTELGTVYTAAELTALHTVCQRYHMPLYVDGARLGYALCSSGCDITLPFLTRNCEAFYIGGTKVGALCGEAVVFPRGGGHPHFFSIVKQHGALLAKGRLCGVQFDALFTDGLYFRISRQAISTAMRLRRAFTDRGFQLAIDSPTNQQFVILDDNQVARLAKHVAFTPWSRHSPGRTVCRLVTCWASTDEQIDELERILDTYLMDN